MKNLNLSSLDSGHIASIVGVVVLAVLAAFGRVPVEVALAAVLGLIYPSPVARLKSAAAGDTASPIVPDPTPSRPAVVLPAPVATSEAAPPALAAVPDAPVDPAVADVPQAASY